MGFKKLIEIHAENFNNIPKMLEMEVIEKEELIQILKKHLVPNMKEGQVVSSIFASKYCDIVEDLEKQK